MRLPWEGSAYACVCRFKRLISYPIGHHSGLLDKMFSCCLIKHKCKCEVFILQKQFLGVIFCQVNLLNINCMEKSSVIYFALSGLETID
jgi:hypothetical protein